MNEEQRLVQQRLRVLEHAQDALKSQSAIELPS